MKTQNDYFNEKMYQYFSAAFNTLNKRFNFSQIDLKEFNKLYQKFLKRI